jgi:antitoxin MazE
MAEETHYRTRLPKKRQLTLPDEISEILAAREGDDLVFRVNEQGQVYIEKVHAIPPDQAWFWSDRWQRYKHAAQADIDAGRTHRFDDAESAIEHLEGNTDAENRDNG